MLLVICIWFKKRVWIAMRWSGRVEWRRYAKLCKWSQISNEFCFFRRVWIGGMDRLCVRGMDRDLTFCAAAISTYGNYFSLSLHPVKTCWIMWNRIWLQSAKHSKEFKRPKQAWLFQEGLCHSFSQQLSEGKFQALPEPSAIHHHSTRKGSERLRDSEREQCSKISKTWDHNHPQS